MGLLNWITNLGQKRALELVNAAEIYKLKTAISVIRRMIISGEYNGEFMCVTLNKSRNVTDEERQITKYVINHMLIDNENTLINYLINKKREQQGSPFGGWVHNRQTHEDYKFMTEVWFSKDAFAKRVVFSNWYLKKLRVLESQVADLREYN